MPNVWIPNRAIEKELKRDPEYLPGLAEAAKPAAEAAKNFAPVDEGDYRDSIGVRVLKATVRLEAKDFKALWIEFGTEDTPNFGPLRRGARAAGLQFKQVRK